MACPRARGFFIAALLVLLGSVWTPPVQAQAGLSLDARHTDVRDILHRLAEMGNLNVVIGPDVTGTVTLRLHDVSVDEALRSVLKAAGLVQVRQGTTVEILSREAWLRQQRQQVELHTLGLGATKIAVVPLHYAKAAELAPLLAPLLSPWGAIAVDERTNSLIIRDVPGSPLFQKPQGTP